MATSATNVLKQFVKTLEVLPKVIVLDIDCTVWPFHVDCMVSAPFKSDGNGGATDRWGYKIALYKDVRAILKEVRELEVPLAAASRTDDPAASRALLGVLELDTQFQWLEIFPARKFNHFKNIQKSSGVEYKEMLFFDDEYRNIRDISTLGVTCVHIDEDTGLDMAVLKTGLEQFSRKHKV